MKRTLSDIAEIVQGELIGDPQATVEDVAGLDTAAPNQISFVTEDRLDQAAKSRAGALVVPRKLEDVSVPQIVVEKPYDAFLRLLRVVEKERRFAPEGVHPTAAIGKSVTLGEGVSVGAHVSIGDGVLIGEHTVIYPNVSIGAQCRIGRHSVIHSQVAVRERVILGDRVIVHCNTTIGGDGFGYRQDAGRHVKVPQIGTVQIGNDVEIGCNCTIDRATMDKTLIGDGVKIDNHSHIAHNCRIGAHSLLIAYARMGGSTVIGKNCLIAEDVGITDNVTIGDGAIVGGSSKVSKNIPPGSVVWGFPAQPIAKEKKERVLLRKLPEMWDVLRALKKRAGL